jgi:hypothetical protein
LALVGALLVSCGDSSRPAAAQAAGQQPSAAAETAPEAGGDPAGEAVTAGGEPAISGDGLAEGPAPARPRGPVGGRPGGAPPGVGHELPQLNGDLHQKRQWKESLDASCREADLQPGCLTVSVSAFRRDKKGKKAISDPGDSYSDDEFSECTITNMNPKSSNDGGAKTIPAGSVIKVTVVCTVADPGGDSGGGSGGDSGSTEPSAQPDHHHRSGR